MRKWNDNAVTRRLGIEYPIVQGPFGGGHSSALLAATVSNAGGLGSFGAHSLEPEEILQTAAAIREQTSKPFALNLWVSKHDAGGDRIDPEAASRLREVLEPLYRELNIDPPLPDAKPIPKFEDQAAAVIEAQPPVFSFIFGAPSPDIIRECKRRGIVLVGSATIPDEAEELAGAGVDMVVASGFEAGGHRPSFLKSAEASLMGTMSLVPQVVDRVDLPVIAAGGIADGRGVAAALKLGAQAAQIGTAFLACAESGAHPVHREMLFSEKAAATVLSRVFSGRLARAIRNRLHDEIHPHEACLLPYPAQSWMVSTLRAAAEEQGRTDLIAWWAGQSARLLRHRSADELMHSLVEETDRLLQP